MSETVEQNENIVIELSPELMERFEWGLVYLQAGVVILGLLAGFLICAVIWRFIAVGPLHR